MLQTTLGPRIVSSPVLRDIPVADVTVVMPFFDRLKYLKHYVDEGLWDGLRVQIVCDGPPADVVATVRSAIEGRRHIDIYSYAQNRGVAFARRTGINIVRTPYLSFCDDDDFLRQAPAFFTSATEAWSRQSDLLFTVMPHVYAFNESLETRLQYDRSPFHGKTGREVLAFLVKTGEMCVLTLGAMFQTDSLKGIEPESFFRVSEDYTFLARLCARYPERRVAVSDKGVYMRLVDTDSLSSRASYSLDKLMMHLVSMFVGAYYLIRMGDLRLPAFQQILLKRGDVLQASYNKGTGAARYMASLIGFRTPQASREFREAQAFLEEHRAALPAEFCKMVGWPAPAQNGIAFDEP